MTGPAPGDLIVECVEDLASIEACTGAWVEVAARSLEPNVFFEPPFLLPAFRHLVPRGGAGLLEVWRKAAGARRLVGVLPIARESRTRSLPIASFGTWEHPYSFLGTPLLDPDHAEAALRALLLWSRGRGRPGRLLCLDRLNADGECMRLLKGVLEEMGVTPWMDRSYRRPMLLRYDSAEEYLKKALSSHRRTHLRRSRKKLASQGEISFHERGVPEAIDEAARAFLELEASGWKGRAGTAMAAQPGHGAFFREVMRAHAERGCVYFDTLCLDGAPIAMRCCLVSGEAAFCFKAAFSERHSKDSPGTLLEEEHIRFFYQRSRLRWMDSCASGTNSPTYKLWFDRREVQSLLVPAGDLLGRTFLAVLPLLKRLKRRGAKADPLPERESDTGGEEARNV